MSTDESSCQHLLFVSQGVPHPSRGASAVLFFSYLQALCNAGHEIDHLVISEGASQDGLVQSYRSAIDERQLPVQVQEVVTGRCCSLKDILFNRHSYIDTVKQSINLPSISQAVCIDIPSALAVKQLPIRHKVVWLGDLRFQTSWFHFAYGLQENPRNLWRWPLEKAAVSLWRKLYAQALQPFNRVVVSSHSSVRILDRLGIPSTFEPYPWPVEPQWIERSPSDSPTFYFFGGLNALGSRSAFHFLLQNLIPRMKDQWGAGNFDVLISGSGEMPTWAKAGIETVPEIRYLGFVEDLDTVLASVTAVLFPIDVPVGNRSRVLTAMAKGVPVIAHQNVALGNPDLVDGKTALLAREPDEFIEKMILSFEGQAEMDSLRARAYQCYREHYDPQPACAAFLQHLQPLGDRS